VHPLAEGAERFYRYALGGVVTVRLPDGTAVPLRELRVTAVRPEWKLSTGSFWFDARDGQLVRAVYRVSGQMDLWATARASGGGPAGVGPAVRRADDREARRGDHRARPLRRPLLAAAGAARRGTIRTGSSRIGVRVEQAFRYDAVDGVVPLGEVTARTLAVRAARDSLVHADSAAAALRDSLVRLAGGADAPDARRARRRLPRVGGLVVASPARGPCGARSRRVRGVGRDDCHGECDPLRARLGDVRVRIPCDTAALAAAPVFGGSGVLDENPSVWTSPERETLVAQLDAAVPSAWAPQPVRIAYGHEFVRANRVEGVSYGAALRRELGAGWRWEGGARLGAHDLEPNAEPRRGADARCAARCAPARTDGLVVSDDWGPGFTIGASIQNVFAGLDEQFYHRAGGVELAGGRAGDALAGGGLTWRVFGERQWRARGDARLALPALFGVDSVYTRNVVDTVPGRAVTVGGAAVRWRAALVGDPATPWRVATDVRAEAAAGTAAWARGAMDATVERALPGSLRAAVTAAAGTSAGAIPPQRWWNLGGWQTVRGVVAGTQRGSAFWSTRSELRWQRPGLLQPAAFFDAGWAGDRAHLGGRPLRGAGGGLAVLNGLARFDVARGLDRGARWRAGGYVVARF
jgi:hypothetical protein